MPLLLYALALVVRGWLIVQFPDPAYPDSAYYVDVARALAHGQGFNVDFIWIFAEVGGTIPADPVLPIPSNAHWMPLASLVQVPFVFVFGDVAWASAIPFALIGALAAPLTWAMARDLGARPLVAIGAGILVAVPVLTTPFMAQPDNFSLFQPLVVASLWLGARALRGGEGATTGFIAAGLLAGLATLARNDGLLVLAALGVTFVWDRTRVRRSAGTLKPTIPIWAALVCVAAFALAMAPWWARQWLTFGSISPSMASGKVLFIRDIAEWNDITTPATLDHLLGMGPVALIATRIGGLLAAINIYVILVCGVVLAPAVVVGRLGASPLPGLRAGLRLRGAPLRVLRPRLRGPRARRDVHPLGGGARATQLHPRPGGDRRRRGLDRHPPSRVAADRRDPGLHRSPRSRSAC